MDEHPLRMLSALSDPGYTDILVGDLHAKPEASDVTALREAGFARHCQPPWLFRERSCSTSWVRATSGGWAIPPRTTTLGHGAGVDKRSSTWSLCRASMQRDLNSRAH